MAQTSYGQLKRDDSNFPAGWSYATSTASTATIIKASPGILHSITFNKPVATAVVSIYDNTTATLGTLIGTITVPSSPQPVTLFYDVAFNTGLSINVATAVSDITISYI